MLLAVDIGNTNIVLGVHDGQQWLVHWRAQTVRERMMDEYLILFKHYLQDAHLSSAGFERVILSSVVPQLTQGMVTLLTLLTGQTPLIVHAGMIPKPIALKIDDPAEIGSDLLANAVAAYDRFGQNCIAVDFGTATTFTAIAAPGELLGVAIAAGLNLTASALVERAARLPQIPLTPPPSMIGTNTTHAMQAGLVMGYVAMVEGIIDRMKTELDGPKVVATGGLSSMIAPLTDRFDAVEPWLTLDGLRLIAERQ